MAWVGSVISPGRESCTPAIREAIVLIGSDKKLHLGVGLFAGFVVVGGAIWHFHDSQTSDRWVGGSSAVGLVLGSIAGDIILFELLLWPRKRMRRYKLGPTRFWMAAHLWFGLAAGPLAYIHAGYRFGGTFTSVLMGLLLFVLLSGLYGWVMQIVIPKWMLGNLPAETITAQIDDVSIQNALDARRMITVAYGPKPDGLTKLTNLDEFSMQFKGNRTARDPQTGHHSQIVIGAVQRRGLPRSRTSLDAVVDVDPADANTVWKEYAAVIEPFLLSNVPQVSVPINIAGSRIRTKQRSIAFFSLLRESCSPSAATMLNRLEGLCEQRQQFDRQRKAQTWLHSWIAIHASASIILGVMLIAHIVLAIRYM